MYPLQCTYLYSRFSELPTSTYNRYGSIYNYYNSKASKILNSIRILRLVICSKSEFYIREDIKRRVSEEISILIYNVPRAYL